MRRLFKKLNRRTIVTATLMLLIFVMSLGYAALSQFIEIDGVALIDRTWNIKITNVTSSVEGDGLNKSSPYVGSTVTMNASLPTSSSKVTYTITLENQGNIKAKLHSIEKIEDKNTSITYTMSGVEEGSTKIAPGETNTVTVVVSYANGVTSASNVEKRLMLSFNYVEDTQANIQGGTTVTYDIYSAGEKVTLLDGSTWTVVENSNENQEYVTLFADLQYGEASVFDAGGSAMYDPTLKTNIGYTINNTVLPIISGSLLSKGGDTAGISGRLISGKEISRLSQISNIENEYALTYDTWTMTEVDSTHIYYLSNGKISSKSTAETGLIRPVIVVKKSNITTPKQYLIDKILSDNTAYADNVASPYVSASTGIDFSQISSDTNGKGLYYTSTRTEGNNKTYYFRGEVNNNYVKFGKKEVTIDNSCMYGDYALNVYMQDYEMTEEICNSHCIIDDGGKKYLYRCGESIMEPGVEYVNGTTTYIPGGTEIVDILWRIVRINEDGSIRLITQDTVGDSVFNTNYHDNAYVGYMYGLTAQSGVNAYSLTHANTTDSKMKDYLDDWYTANLSSYASKISNEVGFCNDRSVAPSAGLWFPRDTALGYATNQTYYGAYYRLYTNKTPQFACPNEERDLFTTSTSSKGNKALSNPIGLLTIDEVAYAGSVRGTLNESMYLTNVDYRTMSPGYFNGYYAYVWSVSSFGSLHDGDVSSSHGVRPVINLKSTVELSTQLPSGCTEQNGTEACPYIIG